MSNNNDNTILIIDDQEDHIDIMGLIFKKNSLKYESATNHKQALISLKHIQPWVILLDIYMADLNGIAFISEIHKISPHLLCQHYFLDAILQQCVL